MALTQHGQPPRTPSNYGSILWWHQMSSAYASVLVTQVARSAGVGYMLMQTIGYLEALHCYLITTPLGRLH